MQEGMEDDSDEGKEERHRPSFLKILILYFVTGNLRRL